MKPAFIGIASGAARLQLLNASATDVSNLLFGVDDDGDMARYEVVESTDDENPPHLVRAANYNADTNPIAFAKRS